ncbi:hypothetical protein [Brucella intermedia]
MIVQFARALAMSVKMATVVGLTVPQTMNVAYANKLDLPKPYVSRALDAVLIPINHASRHRYQIPPKLRGVYVLAVAPHGIAARQGIRPGDVLATVRNKPILEPSDVDSLVWAALALSATSFLFGVNRGTEVSDIVEVNTNITVNNFNTNISVSNISQWTSVDSREEWTQIVDEYDDDMETSINDTSYRDEDPVADSDGQDSDASSPDPDSDNSHEQDDSDDTNDDDSNNADDDNSTDDDNSDDNNADTDTDDSSDDDNSSPSDDGDDDSTNADDNRSDDNDNSSDDADDSSDQDDQTSDDGSDDDSTDDDDSN